MIKVFCIFVLIMNALIALILCIGALDKIAFPGEFSDDWSIPIVYFSLVLSLVHLFSVIMAIASSTRGWIVFMGTTAVYFLLALTSDASDLLLLRDHGWSEIYLWSPYVAILLSVNYLSFRARGRR